MAAGIAVGHFMSGLVTLLNGLTVSGISLPITVLIWIMIFPMMMEVDFESIRSVGKILKVFCHVDCQLACEALFHVSCGLLFPDGPVPLLDQHGPCPSVSCRSRFVRGGALHGHGFCLEHAHKGDPAYTVVQVATNDLIILVAFIPIVRFLLGVSQVAVPYGTLFLSVILFVLIPL